MKYRNQFLQYKLQSNEQEGQEGGGGGGEEKPDIAAMQAELERLRNHTETLLGEKKAEAEKRREAEAEAQRKADEKALKDKDYEQLYKSSTEKNEEWKNKYESLSTKVANKEKDGVAMELAASMADGYNVKLLAEQFSKRLKYTDDGVKVTSLNGELTVSSFDDLKAEFKNEPMFASLIRGSQASGGGATGGKNSGGAAKEITRGDFNKKSPLEQAAFFKSGGSVISD